MGRSNPWAVASAFFIVAENAGSRARLGNHYGYDLALRLTSLSICAHANFRGAFLRPRPHAKVNSFPLE